MKRICALLTVIALAALPTLGCSEAPQEELAAARAEIERARQAQAETWAPDEFQAAQSALNAAEAEVTSQDDSWFKSYGRAKELLAHATAEASKAADLAPVNREQAARDADAAISAADTELTMAESSLRSTPAVPQTRSERTRHKADLEALRASLDEARRGYEAQDYKKAIEGAATVKEGAALIATQLEELKEARGIRPQK